MSILQVDFLHTTFLPVVYPYTSASWYIICAWIPTMLLLLSHFSRVWFCATHRQQPTRLPCPWDSPGKNTGVGCHFLLQCMKVKSESEVTQLCPTLCNPMDCSPPGSSAHGIFQARVLEWGAIAFSKFLPYCTTKTHFLATSAYSYLWIWAQSQCLLCNKGSINDC